jgi:hypothetical protein
MQRKTARCRWRCSHQAPPTAPPRWPRRRHWPRTHSSPHRTSCRSHCRRRRLRCLRCAVRRSPQTTGTCFPQTSWPPCSPRVWWPGGTQSCRWQSSSCPCSTGTRVPSRPRSWSASNIRGTHPARSQSNGSATGTRTSHRIPWHSAAANNTGSACSSTPTACCLPNQPQAIHCGACTHRSTGYGPSAHAPSRQRTWCHSPRRWRSTRTTHSWAHQSSCKILHPQTHRSQHQSRWWPW